MIDEARHRFIDPAPPFEALATVHTSKAQEGIMSDIANPTASHSRRTFNPPRELFGRSLLVSTSLALSALFVPSLVMAQQAKSPRAEQAAPSQSKASEAAVRKLQADIRILERKGKGFERMSKADKAALSREAGVLYRRVSRQSQSAAFGGIGKVDGGTGTVSCLQSCEFENSQCKKGTFDFLCDLQAAKCLLNCALD